MKIEFVGSVEKKKTILRSDVKLGEYFSHKENGGEIFLALDKNSTYPITGLGSGQSPCVRLDSAGRIQYTSDHDEVYVYPNITVSVERI